MVKVVASSCVWCLSDSLELGELDLDGEGGCKFLRVMCWSDSLELGELDLDGDCG